MNWLSLVVAGCFEILGVYMINRYLQKSNLKNFLALVAAFTGSFTLLSYAMLTIPMSTAYAVWTGIGASGGAILSIVLFGEKKTALRVIAIAMVLGAAIGLKLVE